MYMESQQKLLFLKILKIWQNNLDVRFYCNYLLEEALNVTYIPASGERNTFRDRKYIQVRQLEESLCDVRFRFCLLLSTYLSAPTVLLEYPVSHDS